MDLKTVRVPAGMDALFHSAEHVVSRYFAQREHTPERGTIEIQGERYVLVRGAALSVEFFTLVAELFGPDREEESRQFSLNILFDLAHAVGCSDARDFHARMGLSDPMAKLSAGPVHFAHMGWAFVDIAPESSPSPDHDFFMLYDHPYSFESDAWRRAGRPVDFPVCIMNAGYSSGWCEESFGVKLVATEVLCAARGDHTCRFVMAPPARIEERVAGYMQTQPRLAAASRSHQVPDFFARKRLEDELRQAKDSLEVRVAERTEELRLANERLRAEMEERALIEQRLLRSQKLEALGGLAGGIAHDFNNLLTAIRGYADLVSERVDDDEKLSAYVGQITSATERAARLTEKLLVFGRHEARSPRLLDMSFLVREMADMLSRLIGEDVRLLCDTIDESACVLMDPGHAEQVIVNLCVNARDAMPRGGDLIIGVRLSELADARALTVGTAPGPKVVLSVRDTGTGMSPATLDRIFDPFFTTKALGKGTGLGLATVYGIAQQCGAGIVVESEEGQGTTFELWFQHAEGSIAASAPQEELLPPMAPLVVLLVEDEAPLRSLISQQLEGMGHTVHVAADAAQARHLFTAHADSIGLVLADVIMPEMSGPELVVELRRERASLRVLFMSGYTDEALARYGLDRDRDALLAKPFSAHDLERRLRELVRETDLLA